MILIHPRKASKLHLFGIQKTPFLVNKSSSTHGSLEHPRLPNWRAYSTTLTRAAVRNPWTSWGCHVQPTVQHAQLRAILCACMLLWCARSQTCSGCYQFFKSSNLRCLNILQLYLNNKILQFFFLITAVFNTKKNTALFFNTIKKTALNF